MKKSLKIVGIILLVFVIALFTVPMLFKGKMVKLINKTVNEQLNAKVAFSDVSLSLIKSFPHLNVELRQLSVVGIDTFALDTLVAFDKMSASLNLRSLFGDKVEVRTIKLINPQFSVIYLADGRANYDIAKVDSTATEDTTTTESTFKLGLKKFVIENGRILYDDRGYDMKATMTGVNYEMSGDVTLDFTSLKNHLEIASLTYEMEGLNYLTKAKIVADAMIDADLVKFRFDLKDNKIRLNELNFYLDGFVEMPFDDIVMNLKYKTQKAEFKHFLSLIPAIYMTDYAGLKASGTLAAEGWITGTYSDDSIPGFKADVQIENGRFQYPDLPKSVDNVNVKMVAINYGRTGDDMDVDISKFHIEMAGNPFDVQMHARTSAADVALKGKFEGTLDFNTLKDIIPLDSFNIAGILKSNVAINGNLSSIENEKYDEFQADGSVELKDFFFKNSDLPMGMTIVDSKLMFSPQFVELQSFNSLIGQSDIQLKGKVENFLAYMFTDEGVISGNLDFASNNLNLNEFMSGEETAETTTETDSVPLTAFEVPKNIDFRLTSNIKKVQYDNLQIADILGIIVLKDQKVTMENLAMKMLGGKIVMNGSYDSKDINRPVVDFGLDIQNFNIPETFAAFNTIQQLAPIAQKCNGLISTGLKINMALDNGMNPLFGTLNGLGILKSDNVEIKGAKLFSGIADLLKQEKYRQLSLKNLTADFIIEKGNIILKPFTTKLAENKAIISGTQNLDKTINYNIDMQIPRAQFGAVANNLLNSLTQKAKDNGLNIENKEVLDVVLKATGTLSDPKFNIFPKGGEETVTEEVKEEVKEVVKDKVEEKANEAIENLDVKAQEILKKAEAEAAKIRQLAKEAGDKLIAEADKNGKKLIEEAGSNPIKKKAAELAADKLNKEAKLKADKLNAEADLKSKAVMEKANKEAAEMKENAKKKVN